MDVYVKTKYGRKRSAHEISPNFTLVMNKGTAKLQDKKQIEDLLASEVYNKSIVEIDEDKSPLDLVNAYLDGSIPDRLTTEILNDLPDEAIFKLAIIAKTKNRKHTAIIKKELRKTYITNEMQLVLEDYKGKKNSTEDGGDEDALDKAIEAGKVIRKGAWYKDKHDEGILNTNKREEALNWVIENEI